ncbi:MAG: hypothetical protein K8R10_08125 [Rhodocyclales bacterium]|nr:hypothetical protein [Rhodocyclales bacterium]
MQLKLIPAIALFLGSYFPLSVILLLQNMKGEYWEQTICLSAQPLVTCELPQLVNPGRSLTLFVACFISLAVFFAVLRRIKGEHQLVVDEAKTIPNDLINYVFPYVVSFMGLDMGSTGKFYGFILFLGWMFAITYRSGQILMNPLLLVMGWQLYDLKARREGHIRFVRGLSRTPIRPGDHLRSCLVQGIYVLSKEE